jgi:dethiobiotin synthetase
MHKEIFISATGTDVGKTFFSKLILENWLDSEKNLAYYKPIQCGFPTDLEYIKTKQPRINCYNSYTFKTASSPDYAARKEKIKISIEKILEDYKKIKEKHERIIVEGAGGLAVPINDKELISDIIKALKIPLILVISPRLGTINHSLLSIEHARSKALDLIGLLLARSEDMSETELAAIESIKNFSKLKILNKELVHDRNS